MIQTKSGLDEYTRNARLKPAFLVALPLALTVAVLGFKGSATEGTLFGLASSLGFTFLLSQLVRDRGKAKEPRLFERWNGKPTTAMLRHHDPRLNAHTRARYHMRLSSMLPGISLPTEGDEQADPAQADSKYASCVDYLLSKTRDKERFQLLFQENINYGFRRNLWAMKPVGVAIAVFSLGALALITTLEARTNSVPWFANATAVIITGFLLTWWLIRITPNWVRAIADAYAIRLLACVDELQP
ncbi:MAG: hypothetical protein WCC04_21695 [Terriglobales bacterium]